VSDKPEKKKVGDAYPRHIREAALKRVAMGESATHVARSMGIVASTVTRWMKKEGVTKGSALEIERHPMVEPDDKLLSVFAREVRNQNVDEALSMFLQMQDGVEDRYRVLMAQRLYGLLEATMKNPPVLRNWGEIEKAHKIMQQILDPGGSKGGGKTRIDIQVNALDSKPIVVDAEVVDEEDSGN
jgi:transposase-like protein